MKRARLGLTLPLGEFEPAILYASRLARINGCSSLWSFCSMMEISPQKLGQADPQELQYLSDISGTDALSLARFSMRWVPPASRKIAGQIVPNKAINIQTQHVCPKCILEQIDGRESYFAAPHVFWLLDFIRTCPKHGLLLVPLHEHRTGWFPYDFAARLARTDTTMKYLSEQMVSAPSRVDEHSINSMLGKNTRCWLAGCEAYVVSRVSERLGCAVHDVRSVKPLGRADLTFLSDVGFKVLTKGPDALRHLLKELTYARPGCHFKSVFGLFFSILNGDLGDAIPQVRDILREHILEYFLVNPGDSVLGAVCTTRRFHSLQSAADLAGLHPVKTTSVLRSAGLTIENNPTKALLIDADLAKAMLKKLSSSVFTKDAIEYLGMPWRHLVCIKDAGMITPTNPECGGNYLFCRHDLKTLRDLMCQNGRTISRGRENLVPIYKAANQCICGIAEVVKLLISGKLKNVGLKGGAQSFDAIRVDPIEVFEGLPSYEAVEAAMTREELLKEFGVCSTTVAFLLREGHFVEFRTRCRTSRKIRSYVTKASVNRFSEEYVSLRNLADERQVSGRVLSHSLKGKGIYELPVPSRCRGRFFRRADVSLEYFPP